MRGRIEGNDMAKEVRYARIQELLNVRRKFSFLGQFARKLSGFGLCWDLACEEKPEHTLCNNFLAPGSCWKSLLAIWDCEPMNRIPYFERGNDSNEYEMNAYNNRVW